MTVGLVLNAGVVSGQDYPRKPIRMVSPGPGGGADFVARSIAQGISGPLGQQVVVDNRPAGVIPGQIVSKARPDGYTLMVNGNSFWIAPLMQDNIPYDPLKDFSPITSAVGTPNILVVHPSVAASSVKDLIALAKARPGALNYGSASAGGSVSCTTASRRNARKPSSPSCAGFDTECRLIRNPSG